MVVVAAKLVMLFVVEVEMDGGGRGSGGVGGVGCGGGGCGGGGDRGDSCG